MKKVFWFERVTHKLNCKEVSDDYVLQANELLEQNNPIHNPSSTQQAITVMTKQAVQDKLTSQVAITELTKQVVDLTVKLDKANGVDSAPETPTNVTSTATTSGANVIAK